MNSIKNLYLDFVVVIILTFYNYLSVEWNNYHLIGLFFITVSLPYWMLARVQLGGNFSVKPKAKGLTTTGLYSKFRNPIYLFSCITIFGAILPSKSLIQYCLFFLLLFIQLVRIKKEEEILEKKFGKKYLQYKAKTWVL